MMRHHSCVVLIGWTVAVSLMSGCGGDAADALARVTGSAPRCKTPAEAIERFNHAHATELVDVKAVIALIHPENQWQADLVSAIRSAVPIYELDAAMRAEYAMPLERCPLETILAPVTTPAQLSSEEESRATATYIDCNGKQKTLHLTRQGSHWMLSGYTLEYDDNIKNAFATGTLLAMNRTFSRAHDLAPTLIGRLRQGEFRSANAAKKAIIEAVSKP